MIFDYKKYIFNFMPLPRITKNSGTKITSSVTVKEKHSPEKKKESVEKKSIEKKEQLLKFPKKVIKNNGVYRIGVDKDGYLKEGITSTIKFKSIKQFDYDENNDSDIFNDNSITDKRKRLEFLSNLNSLTEEQKIEFENLNSEINGIIKRKVKNKN